MSRTLLVVFGALALLAGGSACTGEAIEDTRHPKLTEAQKLVRRGRVRLAAGDLEGARASFESAHEAGKTEPWGRLGLASLDTLEGNHLAAQAHLKALREEGVAPEEHAPWLVAMIDGSRSLPQPAPPDTGQAVVIDIESPPEAPATPTPAPSDSGPKPSAVQPPPPQPQTPAEQEAHALYEKGEYAEVVARLGKSDARSIYESSVLGDSYYALRNWDEAVRIYRRVLMKRPGDERVTQHLADALLRLGRHDEGIRFYTVLADTHPDRPAFWRLVGDAQVAKGDPQAAIVAYEKALAGGYDTPDLRKALEKARLAPPRPEPAP